MGLVFNKKKAYSTPPSIINANAHHMALLFLLDTSGNIGDRDPVTGIIPINELNDAINRFKYEVCQDPHTKDILDVAVMEYNEGFRIIQDFSPVEYLQPIKVKAKGNAYVCDALNAAVDMVSERSRLYRRSGAEPYKPWIVVITNGMTMDESAVIDYTVARVSDQVNKNNVAVWTLMAGDAVSKNINASWLFHQLCGKRVLKLRGFDFSGFFDWINKSIRAVSQSSPGEKIQGQSLPQTLETDAYNTIQEQRSLSPDVPEHMKSLAYATLKRMVLGKSRGRFLFVMSMPCGNKIAKSLRIPGHLMIIPVALTVAEKLLSCVLSVDR